MAPPFIVRQFRQPTGALGDLVGWVMAMRPSNRARNRWTLDLLDLQPADHVLELGCGPGFALQLAARRTRRGRVLGVDHSPQMVAAARRRLGAAVKKGRADAVCADIAGYKPGENVYDAIYSVNVIQFIENKSALAEASFAALQPGGRFAATYQPRGASATSAAGEEMAERLMNILSEVGFSTPRIERLPLKPVPAICAIGVKPQRS